MGESFVWIYWGVFFGIFAVAILSKTIQNNFIQKNQKYAAMRNSVNKTGAQIAQEILKKHNVLNVQVLQGEEGKDHFDPRSNIIRLSPSVYNSSSVSAAAISAHEVGHALQWSRSELKIKIRDGLAKPVQIISGIGSSMFGMALLILIFNPYAWAGWIAMAGILAYGAAGMFQLITLPVEFDASRKAMHELQAANYITAEEVSGAKSLLTSAAMTYVFAFLTSFLIFLLFLMNFLARRN